MSGNIPAWIVRVLGITAPGPGQAVRWHLDVNWFAAPWATLLLVVFAAACVAGIYRRERPSASRRAKAACVALRWALIGWVLLLLAEPTITLERTDLPGVVILIDESASMSIADRYDNPDLRRRLARALRATAQDALTRLDLAKMVLTRNRAALLTTISERHRLKVYSMASAVRLHAGDLPRLIDDIRALRPSGSSSRLGSALRTVLTDAGGTPPAAIILLTDGITTHGPNLSEAAVEARHRGVPLLVVGLGSATAVDDVQLTDLLVDEVVFVDDVVDFQCTVTARGFAGREVDVVLKEKDRPEVLAQSRFVLGDDGVPATVRLPYRPTKEGRFEYVVEVTPMPDEAQTDNNRLRRLVQVCKQQIRVLLVERQPSYEFRYLKHLFERDTTVEVNTLLQDADPDYAQLDRSALRVLPADQEGWFAYDVLVLGDVDPSLLSAAALAHIRDFVVQKGGGVVFIAGPRFMPLAYDDTPLEPLFPIELSTARAAQPAVGQTHEMPIRPTELGLASPTMQLGDTADETTAIWNALPGVYWCLDTPDVRPAARVLATCSSPGQGSGPAQPVICLQYVGAGRVLMHGTDATWRWRWRVGDTHFARYWIQSLRYLARSKLLGRGGGAELTVHRREYQHGEPVRLRVRFVDERQAPAADDAVRVVVVPQQGRRRHVTLHRSATRRGIFEGTLADLDQGSYHAWMVAPVSDTGVPSADFLVTAPADEWQRVRMDAADLARAAEVTRGNFYTIGTVADLPAALPLGRQVPVETLPPVVLWNRWWVLLAGIAMLVSEWLIRKRNGLL